MTVFSPGSPRARRFRRPRPTRRPASSSWSVAIGLLVGSILAVVGLLRRSATGWVLAVVTGGAILAINLGWWASGEPRYVSMAINAVLLLYLNQRDVRAIYGDLA